MLEAFIGIPWGAPSGMLCLLLQGMLVSGAFQAANSLKSSRGLSAVSPPPGFGNPALSGSAEAAALRRGLTALPARPLISNSFGAKNCTPKESRSTNATLNSSLRQAISASEQAPKPTHSQNSHLCGHFQINFVSRRFALLLGSDCLKFKGLGGFGGF